MSAPTHTRPHPATMGGVDIRLPWWAVALPALAFVALLLLILNPAQAQAASGDPVIGHLLERIQQALLSHAL
ncbi:hypothetical protein ACSCB1_27365 [Streptomyces europaeiscabiei]|uniref:Secreted protein n=1 Tax=Streptomyces europaeiscabiei TaxID=146819 RepID=A0ABU4NK46_9ACTN|nr:hypothetical protein [Streptomyces europaeiscabiei]MDX3543892.1 hypothetical protein [Streptomyces europaeiscabiei]MDX3553271.1 hypothetical protein [Streptomyces europaeiscabiei]MDX3701825.1 hypothetical protein [Streptomyces europaeiscabiei]MDX3778874.1 hypothetical protein [Streptomyces europaeiscabiei]MDX3859414.1 hypothetical protein [Streptomyces europaeiscabiei]